MGLSAGDDATMPMERMRTETMSSMAMSRGRGVCAKVVVCSWEE